MTMPMIVDNSRTMKFAEELGLDSSFIINKLIHVRVGIAISSNYYVTNNGRITLEILLDIISRMYTDIVIEIDHDNQVSYEDLEYLINRINSIGRNISYGNIDITNIRILIGDNFCNKKFHFYISSNGWEAYVSPVESDAKTLNNLNNPIGAAMAAALGATEIFKYALKDEFDKIGRTLIFKPLRFSCFSYLSNEELKDNPELPKEIHIDEITMIGAGAVGMAFISVLQHLNLFGTITVIDNDIVDSSNLDRYLGVYKDDLGNYKTHIICNRLKHLKNVKVMCHSGRYQRFTETYGRKIDIAICTVDNDDTRQELQCDLPRIILNGATGASTYSVSRHNFLDDACLGCLYPIDPSKFLNEEKFAKMLGIPVGDFSHKYDNSIPLNNIEIQVISQHINIPERIINQSKDVTLRDILTDHEVCGRYKLPNSTDIAGAVGFVSAIPGILLVGEVLKEKYFKSSVLRNTFHVDSLYGTSKHSYTLRTKLPKGECSCYCRDDIMIEIYKSKYIGIEE